MSGSQIASQLPGESDFDRWGRRRQTQELYHKVKMGVVEPRVRDHRGRPNRIERRV